MRSGDGKSSIVRDEPHVVGVVAENSVRRARSIPDPGGREAIGALARQRYHEDSMLSDWPGSMTPKRVSTPAAAARPPAPGARAAGRPLPATRRMAHGSLAGPTAAAAHPGR